jgi:hypothetical protein
MGENEVQDRSSKLRTRWAELYSRRFRNVAILHAGRAGALAGTAEKTEIEMLFEAIVEFDSSVGGSPDQVDPAAWRFRFQTKNLISGTLIQAETAMDALIELGDIQRSNLRQIASLLILF